MRSCFPLLLLKPLHAYKPGTAHGPGRTEEPAGANPAFLQHTSSTQSAEREEETRNGPNETGNNLGTEGTGEKTFTQEEVNRIISERLAKEKGKASADLESRAAELDARERKLKAMELLAENNLDKSLIDAINMSSDEQLHNSINILKTINQGAAGTGSAAGVRIGTGNPIGTVGKNESSSDDVRKAMGL